MAEDRWPATRASIILRLNDTSDQEARELALSIYSGPIYQYCIAKGLQQADSLDVTQEVLTKLQRFEYQPEKGKFRAWLGTVTRNQVHQFWRKKKSLTDAEPQLNSLTSEPDIDWDRISRAHILDSALSRIQPEFNALQWEAFELAALKVETENSEKHFVWQRDVSAQAIAEKLGRPVEWIYKTKSAILKRLREEIIFLAEELAIIE